jgi:hypothetical protein
LSVLFPSLAAARGDTIHTRQGVEVFVKHNQSRKLKIIAEAHAIDIEASASDYLRLGSGANGDYIFRKYFSVNAGYKGSFFSFLKQNARDKSYTENNLNSFSVGNAGIRLHILDGKGWVRRRMTLQSFKERDAKGNRRTIVRSLVAKYPCRRIFALRGGVYYSTGPISANMTASIFEPSAKGSVQTADGNVFKGDYYTNTTTSGFYVGLTQITNMKMWTSNTIEWLEGASKLTAIFKETYADIIVTNTTIDPLVVAGKQHEITPNAPGSFGLSNIGWRIGGRLISTRKLINMGTSYEIGSRPGLYQRGAYLSLGITVAMMK